MADSIAITKSDGNNQVKSPQALAEYRAWLLRWADTFDAVAAKDRAEAAALDARP